MTRIICSNAGWTTPEPRIHKKREVYTVLLNKLTSLETQLRVELAINDGCTSQRANSLKQRVDVLRSFICREVGRDVEIS